MLESEKGAPLSEAPFEDRFHWLTHFPNRQAQPDLKML